MGRLKDEMISLRSAIQEEAQDRRAVIEGLKNNHLVRQQKTLSLLESFRQQRSEQLGSFLRKLRDDRQQGSATVARIQNETQQFLSDFREEFGNSSVQEQATRSQSIAAIKDSIAHTLENHARQRQQQAAYDRDERIRNRRRLQGEMPDFAQLREQRFTEISRLREHVASTAQINRDERAAARLSGERERYQFIQKIRHQVSEIAKQSQSQRQELIRDLVAIRSVWSGTLPAQEPVPHVPADGDDGGETRQEEAEIMDDLTTLAGIGPTRNRLLHAAGVYTFFHLAHSSPRDLIEIVGGSVGLDEVGKWIEEAGKICTRQR